MPSAVHDYFEQQANGYEVASERGFWAFLRQREAQAVISLAGECSGRSLLDLGCGAGFYTKRFVKLGCGPAVAVDASAAMLEQIGDPAVTVVNGDVNSIRLRNKFQIVIAAGVLEFVSEPVEVLKNVARHLEAGGRAVLLVPPNTVAGHLYRGFHKLHGVSIGLFDRREFPSTLAGAGLRVREHRRALPFSDVYAVELL